jgi:hypothetical protein
MCCFNKVSCESESEEEAGVTHCQQRALVFDIDARAL